MPISNSNEIVETHQVYNPTLETTQPIRVLINMEQRHIRFLPRDLRAFYGLSVEATKHLVKDRCWNLEPYTGAKLGELSDDTRRNEEVLHSVQDLPPSNMKQVVLLNTANAQQVKPNVDLAQLQAMGKFVRGVVDQKLGCGGCERERTWTNSPSTLASPITKAGRCLSVPSLVLVPWSS